MRENGIHARHKRRYKVTTDSHGLLTAENLLDRHFTPTAPNRLTSDITYQWTDEGWLYSAIVLDLFNREIVGWSLKPSMTADIVTDALSMGLAQETPGTGADASLGPRQSVCQPCVSGQAQGIRHALLNEPQRKLLGQCADGKLVQ